VHRSNSNPRKQEYVIMRTKLSVISDWPVLRQFREGDARGLGESATSERSRSLAPRTAGADRVARSVCPYCAVGCGQLVYTRDGELVDIEGNPRSPISQGTLCPKGSASRQLIQQPGRLHKVLYRRPHGTEWEEIELERAMEMIAERTKLTRDQSFKRTVRIGDREVTVNHTLGLGSLGGATLDNEWNYLQAKLWRGLGGVFLENQARI
jgi:formate dehydrogenase major subunit